MLNDPTAVPVFENYRSQTYDADLDGSSWIRANAYERMLYNNSAWMKANNGGTESQDMFEMLGYYAEQIALAQLQAWYPDSSFPADSQYVALSEIEQLMGIIPDTLGGATSIAGWDNYGITPAGLGEARGLLSCGYDGQYGCYLPQMSVWFYDLAKSDNRLTTPDEQAIVEQIGRKFLDDA